MNINNKTLSINLILNINNYQFKIVDLDKN